MAKFLGSLRVRLTAETEDFKKGLAGASKNLQTFQKSVDKFSSSMLGKVASVGALSLAISRSLDSAKELDRAQSALAASGKIAGQSLDSLNGIVANAESQFKLSKLAATEFTTELAKLADQAGGMKNPTEVLRAFLDVGAARGKTAAESLELLRQATKGSDEATTALLNKKPDILYREFAASIGKAAAELSGAQKAQAILNGVMKDGEAARGEYERWLNSAEGLQYQLSSGMENTSAVMGRALQPATLKLIPAFETLAEWLAKAVTGWEMLGATMALVPGMVSAARVALTDGVEAGKKEMSYWVEGWREVIAEIEATTQKAFTAVGSLNGRGGGKTPPAKEKKEKAPYNEAAERQDILLQDAIDKARILEAIEVSRLGVHATLNQRLDLELGLADRIYILNREAIENDKRLSDEQRRNALLRIDLERKRQQLQLKGQAAAEQELATAEEIAKAQQDKHDAIVSGITGIVGGIMGGGGVSGAQIGSSLGTIAGTFIPGIGTAVGSMVGGFLGGLFDKKKPGQDSPVVVKGLDAVERAQKDTIAAIQAQTDALLKPESRLMNLPSDFSIPAYRPNTGASVNQSTTNNVSVTLNVASSDKPDDLKKVVVQAITDALASQSHNGDWVGYRR